MRKVRGEIVIPDAAVSAIAKAIHIEVRDVAVADAASVVVASKTLADKPIAPGGRVTFALVAPAAQPQQRLQLRVHVDVTGSGRVAAGDLLTTQAVPVAADGDVELSVPLTAV